MSSTTNPKTTNQRADDVVASLRRLTDGQRSAADVAALSDLDRAMLREVASLWNQMPLDQRRYVVRQMAEMAESNVELNFHRVLRLAVSDLDAEVRSTAIAGLWEDESLDLARDLVALLAGEDESAVREAAVVALGRFCLMAALDDVRDETLVRDIRATLLDVLRGDEPVGVRRRALEALSHFSPDAEVEEAIDAAYASPFHEFRVSAVYAMGRSLDRRWYPMVLAELESDDPELRYEAARAAGAFGDQEAVGSLLSMVDDEDREVQFAAVDALGQIGGTMAVNLLRRLTRSDDEAIRDAAEEALDTALYAADPLREPS